MSDNKTQPTAVSVESFLETVSGNRRDESRELISMMREISGQEPVMWGPSIIGFGSVHYKYDTGREGDMPVLAFSPRKASITVYFTESFDRYSEQLERLGKHKISRACLYINKLADIDLSVLREMLEESHELYSKPQTKPQTVEEYIAGLPAQSRPRLDELRELVKAALPDAKEVLSYGIIGYKVDDKRAKVYISGWKDHVAMYPIPDDDELQAQLAPYTKGKGTLWFDLDSPLPGVLIKDTVKALAST